MQSDRESRRIGGKGRSFVRLYEEKGKRVYTFNNIATDSLLIPCKELICSCT